MIPSIPFEVLTREEAMPSILFVCTKNLCRSPFAQAFFNRRLLVENYQGNWLVSSAGTWTRDGDSVPAPFRKIGKELGVDLSQHRSQSISSIDIKEYDVIVVMEKGHKEAMQVEFPKFAGRIYMLTFLAGLYPYDIPDPEVDDYTETKGIARVIQNCIELAFELICQKALAQGN
jgi:protein-tyrosine phosphatase